MSRLSQITDMVEEYAKDSYTDGYDHGHSEGWDECKEASQDLIDEAYDEGYDTGQTNLEADERINQMIDNAFDKGFNKAIEDMQDYYIKHSNFFKAPETGQELERDIENFKDNGPICVAFAMNYLHHKLNQMKQPIIEWQKDESS